MPETDPPAAKVLDDPFDLSAVEDWGPVETPIEGESQTSGTLIHKGPDGRSECGIWICTPGSWKCTIQNDEFCHFIEGRAIYTPESGDEITIGPGSVAFFPEGWRGTCEVIETIRKVYMIR